jgi:uncharacterized protein (TIGR03382 family)
MPTMTLFALLVAPALAHKPWVASPTDYTAAPAAFVIEEPDVSIVVYAERTCDAPQLWLTADVPAGTELFVQLGMPQAEALEGWRPSVAVVAPGLPEADLGFDLPEGTGAVVFPGAEEPDAFDEPFSGTSDWIMVEERVTLPQGGPAWVVAWDPAGAAGRLWVATGERESFTSDDWERIRDLLDDVRDFHGLEGTPVPPPTACEPPEEDAASDAPTEAADEAGGGCASAPGVTGVVALGLALGAVLSRRRVYAATRP